MDVIFRYNKKIRVMKNESKIKVGTKVMYTNPYDGTDFFGTVTSINKKVATVSSKKKGIEEINVNYLLNLDEQF
jgi:hypothetical protein